MDNDCCCFVHITADPPEGMASMEEAQSPAQPSLKAIMTCLHEIPPHLESSFVPV